MKKIRLLGIVFIISYLFITSTAAHAVNVTYDFAGTCQQAEWDCGPLGVLDSAVDSVTGTLELNLSEPMVAQVWDASDVLAYSFTFGDFTIDSANSTLANSAGGGDIPFTTTISAPFSIDDAFLVATYNADSSVFLNIDLGGINLVQGSLTVCSGSCQALAIGSWTRISAVPVPAAAWLFGSGLIGLIGIARRKKA